MKKSMKLLFLLFQANFKLAVSSVKTDFKSELLNVSSRLESFSQNDSYSLSFYFRTLKQTEKLFVSVTIALPTADGDYKSIIANTVQDVCKYIKNTNSNPLLKLFFNGYFGKKRIPTSCPIKSGDYYVENFRLSDAIFKMRIIETKFLVLIEFCASELITSPGRDCPATLRIYGEIREMKKPKKASKIIV